MLIALVTLTTQAFSAGVHEDNGSASRDRLRPIGGGRHHAWFALPSEPRPSSSCTLYHIPADADPGSARIVSVLPQTPVDIATDGDSAVLVYASPPGRPRPVRQITATRLRPKWYVYTQPVPMPPLPGENSFLSFIGHDTGPIALLRTDDHDRPLILRLVRQEWQPLAAPLGLDHSARWSLLPLGPVLGMMEYRDNGQPATLWLGHPDPDGAVAWEKSDTVIEPAAEVISVHAQLVSLKRSREGILSLNLLRGSNSVPLTSLNDIPSAAISVPLGDRIVLAWEPPSPSMRLMTCVVTLSGTVLHNGFAPLNNPVSAGEIQVLGAVLSSLVLTVLIFLLKPDRGASVITLPPGASLAEPSRRLLSTAIDLIPGLLLASTIWSDADSATNFADVGIIPLAVVAGVTVLHTTLAESIFGRTLGKAVLGCRTVTLDGHKPRWSQSLGRNLTKVLCPALVIFVIANPFVSHPGAMGTVVIIDPHDPDSDPRDPDPDPPGTG